ncbi:MAG: YqgE/AlgH family protein [Pseudomonadales bacterium]
MTEQAITHSILLASPRMLGGFFAETVIFILENNNEGSFGFVLNRPAEARLSDLMHDAPEPLQGSAVLLGGPVQIDHLFFLIVGADAPPPPMRIAEDISAANRAAEDPCQQVLAVLGYAGWSPKQLESEIQADDWLVTNANPVALLQAPIPERYAFVKQQLGFDPTLLGQSQGLPQ